MLPLKVGLEKLNAWQLVLFDILTKWSFVFVKYREIKNMADCHWLKLIKIILYFSIVLDSPREEFLEIILEINNQIHWGINYNP